jgi:hypothetical protein
MRLLAALLPLALVACGTTPNSPAAIDYRAKVEYIALEEFDDQSRQTEAEPEIVYNLKHEEGRREAERARNYERRAQFTYAVAHNVALRIKESEDALRAAGMSVPRVVVFTRNYPDGVLATGAGSFGSQFVHAPKGLPRPAVRVRGSIRYDIDKNAFHDFFRHTDLGALFPYTRFQAAADFTIDEPSGTHRHVIAFLSKGEARNLGMPGLDDDPGAQLVARVADHLAPTRLEVKSSEAPIGFVRRVIDERTIEVDVGLARRTLHVAKVHDLEEPLPEPPAREDLERVLGHQYVRIRWRGGVEPPARSIWRRIDVEEAE